ncbi:MAG: hypothetical protein ACLFQV_09425 [Vulcanimicrobiota bacterium]
MKSFKVILIFAGLFIFFACPLKGYSQMSAAKGEKLIKCSVRIDGGKVFNIDSIVPEGKALLEITTLASHMGWKVSERPGQSVIYIDNKPFKNFTRYNGKVYVDANSVGVLFGYRVSQHSSGLVVDFVSNVEHTNLNERSFTLSIDKKEKFNSSIPDSYSYYITASFKNNTKKLLEINIVNLMLVDNQKKAVQSSVSGTHVIKPGQTQKVEKILFNFSNRFNPKYLYLIHKDTVIGKTYW